jgi:transcriptional regulator with XRE-family HTH domain
MPQNCRAIFLQLGSRIRKRRILLHLTQAQVCKRMSCDRRYFQKIESGQANITVATLYKIASALETSIFELLKEASEFPSNSEK